MERLPKGAYTPEFREQAVRLPETEGLTERTRLAPRCGRQALAEPPRAERDDGPRHAAL